MNMAVHAPIMKPVQKEEAATLGISQASVSRRRKAAAIQSLAEDLRARFELRDVRIVPHADTNADQIKLLGREAASMFEHLRHSAQYRRIGVGGGRTIREVVESLRTCDRAIHVTPTSMFMRATDGGSVDAAFNAMGLYWKSGVEADSSICALPPFGKNDPAVKALAEGSKALKQVFAHACDVQLMLVGIGDFSIKSPLRKVMKEHGASNQRIEDLSVVAEFNLALLDADGRDVTEAACAHENRITRYKGWERSHPIFPAVGVPQMAKLAAAKSSYVLGVAGGKDKWHSIRAVLKGKLLSGLVIDIDTAKLICEYSH